MTQRYIPAMAEQCVDVIDVSRWQGPISVPQLKASGRADVVVVKATGSDDYSDRSGYVDPMFQRNCAALRDEGVAREVYHFAGPDNRPSIEADARDEADFLLTWADPLGIDCFALDLESSHLDPSDLGEWVYYFQDEIDRVHRARPHQIYKGKYFALGQQHWPQLLAWRLWMPNYPTDAQRVIDPDVTAFRTPPVAEPWNTGGGFVGWQYTGMGRCDGVAGNVDRSVFTYRWYLELIHNREDIDMTTAQELGEKLDAATQAVKDAVTTLGQYIGDSRLYEGKALVRRDQATDAAYALLWVPTVADPTRYELAKRHVTLEEFGILKTADELEQAFPIRVIDASQVAAFDALREV